MPSRARHAEHGTIKDFAREYFLRVNFVDIYGRNVGYDYDFILAAIKEQFPKARTSKRWLRMMAYELTGTVRMPMRRRSRRALAESFAMSLLTKPTRLSLGGIRVDVKHRFPDQSVTYADLRKLERALRALNFTVPPRP
jgi:hypothetical protein